MSTVQHIYVRQQDMESVFGITPMMLWRLLNKQPEKAFPQPTVLSQRRKVFDADAVRNWLKSQRQETFEDRQEKRKRKRES